MFSFISTFYKRHEVYRNILHSTGFITHEDMTYWKAIAQISEEELQLQAKTTDCY